MNRGQVYASRKDFVENGIGQIMAAKRDFDSIKYARSAVTDREYIRVSDIFGKAVTIEVTGDDLESILHDICKVMLMGDKWVPCDKLLPDRDGVYLVTTANGKIRLDRFVDGAWGLCLPRPKGKGRYRPHKAWTFLPKAYED